MENIVLPIFRLVVFSTVEVDVSKCRAQGGGLVSPVAGVPATFFIEAKDAYGNNVKTAQNFVVAVTRQADNQGLTFKLTPYRFDFFFFDRSLAIFILLLL